MADSTPDVAALRPIELTDGWQVDQAIVTETERVVVIRFGKHTDPECMVQDKILCSIAPKVEKFATIYCCDNQQVPDFNKSKFSIFCPRFARTRPSPPFWTRSPFSLLMLTLQCTNSMTPAP